MSQGQVGGSKHRLKPLRARAEEEAAARQKAEAEVAELRAELERLKACSVMWLRQMVQAKRSSIRPANISKKEFKIKRLFLD